MQDKFPESVYSNKDFVRVFQLIFSPKCLTDIHLLFNLFHKENTANSHWSHTFETVNP